MQWNKQINIPQQTPLLVEPISVEASARGHNKDSMMFNSDFSAADKYYLNPLKFSTGVNFYPNQSHLKGGTEMDSRSRGVNEYDSTTAINTTSGMTHQFLSSQK